LLDLREKLDEDTLVGAMGTLLADRGIDSDSPFYLTPPASMLHLTRDVVEARLARTRLRACSSPGGRSTVRRDRQGIA
jgi:hypothetical protein